MLIFIAALSSTIFIEVSAQVFHRPFCLLCVEILNLLFVLINIIAFELDPASVSCVLEAVTTGCVVCFLYVFVSPTKREFMSSDYETGISIHPSIHFLYRLIHRSGRGGAGAYPRLEVIN